MNERTAKTESLTLLGFVCLLVLAFAALLGPELLAAAAHVHDALVVATP
jgi:hypothetical protein